MPQWTVISKTEHATDHYLPRQGYAFSVNQPVANILLAELSKLLPHYALAFIDQDGTYQPVALLSLDGENNLYLNHDGRWLGSYVPASLRGHPFTLANAKDSQKVLCVDQAVLTSDQGQPLFNAEGELAEPVAKTLDFLKQCDHNRAVTAAAVERLAQADVIEPWPLTLERGDGQSPLKVGGLFRINEKALNALSDDAYAGLRGAPLALAHAQLFSTNQLTQLTERAKLHANRAAQNVPENLDTFFDTDDELSFDFDS